MNPQFIQWSTDPHSKDVLRQRERQLRRKQIYSREIVWTLLIGIATTFAYWIFSPAFLPVIVLLQAGLLIFNRRDSRRGFLDEEMTETDKAFREEFGRHGCFVLMHYHQGRHVTGVDRGMLWVEEGRLTFCGYRSSFSLPRGSIDRWARRLPQLEDIVLPFQVPLVAQGPLGKMSLSFRSLEGSRIEEAELLKRVTSEEIDGQLPPTEVGPEGVPRILLTREMLKAFVVSSVIYWVLSVLSAYVLLFAVLVLFGLFCAIFGGIDWITRPARHAGYLFDELIRYPKLRGEKGGLPQAGV